MKKTVVPLLSVIIALVTVFAAFAEEGPRVWRSGDETVNKIAITVDDCYRKNHVTKILDLCDKYDINITFFPTGNTILPEEGDLWRRIVESGHEIGNHTYGHTKMTDGISYEQCRSRFVRMEKALDTALGYHYEIQLYRPPFGQSGVAVHWRRYERCGYSNIILWSVDQTKYETCIEKVKNGSILLFHAKQKDIDCLEQLIPAVLEQGFAPVTVSELLNLEPVIKQRAPSELAVLDINPNDDK